MIRIALRAASIPYGWAVAFRNRRYDRGQAEIIHCGVPVISVGNLTVGGTGKTPMVEWICRRLRQAGVRTAILSRGYGAEAGGCNDEALELELALPDVPHLQNRDRGSSAIVAVEEFAMQALVLDDGFQHRRLVRDLDVVLLDASAPFGYEYLLPRGMLREHASNLRRARVATLSRADMLSPDEREQLRSRVVALAPRALWCEVVHRPTALIDASHARQGVDSLRGMEIGAFCGIGNPSGFRHTLERLGAVVRSWREFPDHHNYTSDDVASLTSALAAADVELAVCTRKDLVKLQTKKLGTTHVRALAVEIAFLTGEAEFTELVDQLGRRALELSSGAASHESD